MQALWLSPKFLDWDPLVDMSIAGDLTSWRRAYEHWSHAEQLLKIQSDELYRVDVTTTLKRAVDHRIRLLDQTYDFQGIPVKAKPSGSLARLEWLGIVRPTMVRKLLDIRNAVEHSDHEPPEAERCHEFLEFVWYFLRSTDLLVRRPVEVFTLTPNDSGLDPEHYEVEIEINRAAGWVPKLHGWLLANMVSMQSQPEWVFVSFEKLETREAVVARERKPIDPAGWDTGRGMEANDLHVRGEVRGPSDQLLKLLRRYFEAV
jgi:hypothetical protein